MRKMEINKAFKDISIKHKKIFKDMEDILKNYINLESELNSRFKTEYSRNNNKIDGLEDFYSLKALVRKNVMLNKSAFGLLSKIRDMSGFDISEEEVSDN